MSIKVVLIKKNWFRLSIILNLILLVWLMYQLLFAEKVKVLDPNESLNSELEEIKTKYHLIENLLLADTWIISGEHQKALVFYEERVADFPTDLENLVQKRIAYINSVLMMEGNENEATARYKTQLAATQDQMNSLKDELESQKEKFDSLSQLSSEKIELLEREVRLKSQALDRKDKIKVITFTSSKGITVHYLGEVDEGKAQGGGLGIWTTGSKYQGDWKNNLRHGKGVFTWADGEKYDGNYVNDIRQGEGTYYWPSGERYEGEWKNDRRNGQGTLYDKDGNIRYRGTWQDDKPNS